MGKVRVFAAIAGLLWLSGCESLSTSAFLRSNATGAAEATAPAQPVAMAAAPASSEATGSIIAAAPGVVVVPAAPEDPNDDLNLGKRQFRANNFGLAERYFRRAVEKGP